MYYLLVHRLLLHQPTLFQCENDSIVLFDENGISRLSHKALLTQSPTSATWALVDANQSVLRSAQMLLRDGSPFFTVIASSPWSPRWKEMAHYRPPFKLWFMKPFTLEELIQAYVFQVRPCTITYLLYFSRHLQVFKHNEQELQRFFELYGPSACDCYAFCADLSSYRTLIEDRIKSMT